MTQLATKHPLFRDVTFNGLDNDNKKSKKRANVSVRLNFDDDDVIYVATLKNKPEIVGFKDPDTGFLVAADLETDLSLEGDTQEKNVRFEFQKRVFEFLKQKCDEKLAENAALSGGEKGFNQKEVRKRFKFLLEDKVEILTDLNKQIGLLASRPLPSFNEYVAFADEKPNYTITTTLPYTRPIYSDYSKEDYQKVDSFLDVFCDDYSKHALAWYFGAALHNKNVYDQHVSKALLVIGKSGIGKSTLINSLANAVITSPFYRIHTSFDDHFEMRDKHSTASIPRKRLTIYSEAEFRGQTVQEKTHNFDGLNTSAIKSLLTEGITPNEKKYENRVYNKLNGLHIVLTNYTPNIDGVHDDLKRRLLAITIKPTSMYQKAKILGLTTEQAFKEFLKNNQRLFAAYFMKTFSENPDYYVNETYHSTDTEILEKDLKNQLADEKIKSKQTFKDSLNENEGYLTQIKDIEDTNDIDLSALISAIRSGNKNLITENKNGNVFLNGSKNVLKQFTDDAGQLRTALKDIFGDTQKIGNWRAFKLN